MIENPYPAGRLQRLLAEDERVSELGIRVVQLQEDTFALSGEVESAERKALIERLVAEEFPDLTVRCDLGVVRVHEPDEYEEI